MRAGFHDPGEFDPDATDDFGPDGCVSHNTDNIGLFESSSLIKTIVAPLWQDVCDLVNAADFIPLIAKVIVELSLSDDEQAGEISIPLYVGRKTNEQCNLINGRLPGAQPGFFNFHPFFEEKMGLSVFEGGTLLGGHTLGHVHCNVLVFVLTEAACISTGKTTVLIRQRMCKSTRSIKPLQNSTTTTLFRAFNMNGRFSRSLNVQN
jgi:Peroxidase